MCLAFVAIDAHARYPLVIAANRDEYHARVAEPAHWWPEGILAGRDLLAGGTWLGVSRQGRWALVTNVRDAGHNDKSAPSRGSLVVDALGDPQAPMLAAAAALRTLVTSAQRPWRETPSQVPPARRSRPARMPSSHQCAGSATRAWYSSRLAAITSG
jgi:hypothetical protein